MNKNRIQAVIIRHLLSWPRELEAIAEAFWWPSFDIFIWGLTTVFLRQTQSMPVQFVGYFIGAIVLWMVVYRSQQETGFTFLREAWDRNLLNLLVSPLTIWEFTAATVVLGMIKLIISASWMAFLAYILFAFNIFTIGWTLTPFVISLLLTGWSAGFFINGLVIRYGYRIQAFAWTLILIIQPFSAVFYPVSSMPDWMQAVARILPTSYIFEGMREVLGQGTLDAGSLILSFGLNLVYLVLGIWFFRNFYEKARQSGQIMKFS